MKRAVVVWALILAAAIWLNGCTASTSEVRVVMGTIATTTAATPGASAEGTEAEATSEQGGRQTKHSSGARQQPRTRKSVSATAKNKTKTTTKPTAPAVITVASLNNSWFAQDTTNERIRDALRAAEQEAHCTLTISLYHADDLVRRAITADKAGSKLADILVATMRQQQVLMGTGLLRDLNTISGLNLHDSCWDQAVRRDMQVYGKNGMAVPTLDGVAAHAQVLFFNKRLAKQVGSSATRLYTLAANGSWTFKEMQGLARKALKDLDGNDIAYPKATDQYGFTSADNEYDAAYALFKSQGGCFSKTEADGQYRYSLSDNQSVTALRTMQTWFLKDKSVLPVGRMGNDTWQGRNAFQNGRVLFLSAPVSMADELAAMTDDWGLLPYPKADPDDRYVSTVADSLQGLCVPRQVKGAALQHTAAVMQAVARQLEKVQNEQAADRKKSLYRDAHIPQMLEMVKEAATVDFCQFGDMGNGGSTVVKRLLNNASVTPTELATAEKDNAQTHMNAFLRAVKMA